MTSVCGTCKKPENFPEDTKSELRPYGPGGSLICYRCAFATPESTKATENAFSALLNAAGAISSVVVMGDSDGPQPYVPTEKGPDF